MQPIADMMALWGQRFMLLLSCCSAIPRVLPLHCRMALGSSSLVVACISLARIERHERFWLQGKLRNVVFILHSQSKRR